MTHVQYEIRGLIAVSLTFCPAGFSRRIYACLITQNVIASRHARAHHLQPKQMYTAASAYTFKVLHNKAKGQTTCPYGALLLDRFRKLQMHTCTLAHDKPIPVLVPGAGSFGGVLVTAGQGSACDETPNTGRDDGGFSTPCQHQVGLPSLYVLCSTAKARHGLARSASSSLGPLKSVWLVSLPALYVQQEQHTA